MQSIEQDMEPVQVLTLNKLTDQTRTNVLIDRFPIVDTIRPIPEWTFGIISDLQFTNISGEIATLVLVGHGLAAPESDAAVSSTIMDESITTDCITQDSNATYIKCALSPLPNGYFQIQILDEISDFTTQLRTSSVHFACMDPSYPSTKVSVNDKEMVACVPKLTIETLEFADGNRIVMSFVPNITVSSVISFKISLKSLQWQEVDCANVQWTDRLIQCDMPAYDAFDEPTAVEISPAVAMTGLDWLTQQQWSTSNQPITILDAAKSFSIAGQLSLTSVTLSASEANEWKLQFNGQGLGWDDERWNYNIAVNWTDSNAKSCETVEHNETSLQCNVALESAAVVNSPFTVQFSAQNTETNTVHIAFVLQGLFCPENRVYQIRLNVGPKTPYTGFLVGEQETCSWEPVVTTWMPTTTMTRSPTIMPTAIISWTSASSTTSQSSTTTTPSSEVSGQKQESNGRQWQVTEFLIMLGVFFFGAIMGGIVMYFVTKHIIKRKQKVYALEYDEKPSKVEPLPPLWKEDESCKITAGYDVDPVSVPTE